MAAERLHVSLLVDPARLGDVVRSAAAAGLFVEEVLDEIGIVTGSVDGDRAAALGDLDGVDAVEVDRTVRVPPPESPLQ